MTALSLSVSQQIIDGALAKGAELGLKPLCVMVLDARASLRACANQDGTSIQRHRIAHGKANAAIGIGMGSRALMARAEQQAYFIDAVGRMMDGDFVPVPGGVLIADSNGDILGAVGISGDTSDNDEAAAVAGIEAAGFTAITG
ncbi:MAG: GlcG/HbpS family heme-binding protein [Candidatus Puniceispirillaceae bacterium]